MKCPKCGYNSFEFYDACKRCSNDLTGYRETYGLKAIVLPEEACASLAAELATEPHVSEQVAETAEEGHDLFSFDLAEDDAGSAPAKEDPFSFINEPSDEDSGFSDFSFDEEPEQAPAQAPAAEDDDFANLLESTSLGEDDPFAAPAATAPSAASSAAPESSPGEFDLNSFSWDEPEPAQATGNAGAAKEEDDFDSLFGENDETKK